MQRLEIRWALKAALAVMAATEMMASEAETRRRIVVSIPDRKIALIENGQVARVYSIAVGAAATPSPSGEYTVATLIPHPTWYQPGKVVRPGPANPLGTRWIGLSLPGYGIHGTNQPRSIGHNASHGCIRMRNRDVEELFGRVRVGDVVELRGARDAEVAKIFGESEVASVAGEE